MGMMININGYYFRVGTSMVYLYLFQCKFLDLYLSDVFLPLLVIMNYHCWPAPAATLSGALGSADAVVLGSVATLTDNITSASFTINVETVLKGSVGSTTIQVAHPWHYPGGLVLAGPISPSTFAVSLRGIWFLKHTTTSTWDLIPSSGIGGDASSLFWPTPAALPAAYAPAPGASLLDTLMLQAAAGLEAVG